jgi:hypothetical protein
MKQFKSAAVVVLLVALLAGAAAPAAAAEGAISTVFNDAWYGGLTGALVGTAVLVFSSDPGDHLMYIGYGAAGGVLVGTAIGLVDTTRSFAEVRDGRLAFAAPTVVPVVERDPGGTASIGLRADLFRARF